MADEGLLTEGWFWIPSLAGPSSLASRASVSVSNRCCGHLLVCTLCVTARKKSSMQITLHTYMISWLHKPPLDGTSISVKTFSCCAFLPILLHVLDSIPLHILDSAGMVDAQGGGFSWLFPFQNGAPPIGWHDAICYLVLPVALVVSQFITQKILQPPSQDESAQQTNAILKFLPLMIGETCSILVRARLQMFNQRHVT